MNERTLLLGLVEELILATKEAKQIEFSESNTVIAPNYMAKAAERGLKIREQQPKSNKCCEPVGLARANQLANKSPLSLSTLKRMKSFLSRHGGQLEESSDLNSKQAQAIMLWGAMPNKASINKTIGWLNREITKMENS